MKILKKSLLPGEFITIEKRDFFRLKDGKLATQTTGSASVDSSKEESVELFTFEHESRIISRLWKIKDKLYTIDLSSYIFIPEDITFVECYNLKDDRGKYIKYMAKGKYGVIYVNSSEIKILVSHEENYIKISYYDGAFYAETSESSNRYHILDASGKLIDAFSSERRKVNGLDMFYNNESIFLGNLKLDFPYGILSIKLKAHGDIKMLEITSEKGVYYYTDSIQYLLGPFSEVIAIDWLTHRAATLRVRQEGKGISVFFITMYDGTISIEKVFTLKDECTFRSLKRCDKVYVIHDVDDDTYGIDEFLIHLGVARYCDFEKSVTYYGFSKYNDEDICYRYFLCFSDDEKDVGAKKIKTEENVLKFYDDGYELNGKLSKIYRDEEKGFFMIFDSSIQPIISCSGDRIYKNVIWRRNIYRVEKDMSNGSEIFLYEADGKKLSINRLAKI